AAPGPSPRPTEKPCVASILVAAVPLLTAPARLTCSALMLTAPLTADVSTPFVSVNLPVPDWSESAKTVTAPAPPATVATAPVNVTSFDASTLTDSALIPADSKKFWEPATPSTLATVSAPNGFADPTAPVNVTLPAPAVIVSPSAVAVWLSTVLLN